MPRGERGSISLFVVIFSLAALMLASLLVDGGVALNARVRAADIAEQAARAAANDIDVAALRGGTVSIAQDACTKASQLIGSYSAGSGVNATMPATGCAIAATGQSVTVQVSVTTRPLIFASFGNFTVTSQPVTARVDCGITQGGQC
jgi:hypothetical protein